MQLSIVTDEHLAYPDGAEWFSSSTAYPEYRFGHFASRPNMVYDAVPCCFAPAGLDAGRFGTPEWNPLGEFVRPGHRVFEEGAIELVAHRRGGWRRGRYELDVAKTRARWLRRVKEAEIDSAAVGRRRGGARGRRGLWRSDRCGDSALLKR